MRRAVVTLLSIFAVGVPTLGAQAPATPARGRAAGPAAPTKPLEIYVIDPEGGKSALWITPSGETILVDTGSPGGRDTDRIMEAVTAAGVTKIDYLISTHYHVDHVGGLQALAERIPIGTYVDHGDTIEGPLVAGQREQVQGFWQTIYPALYAKAKRIVVKPGDKLPVAGLDWRVVTSATQVLKTPMTGAPGAGRPNPACAGIERKNETVDPDNGASVGSVVTFGQFRAADFGDLLWDNEIDLMCPNNPLGTVDLYMVNHHGLDRSNSAPMIHGLAPRAAVMQNSAGKGAGVATMRALRTSPGLEDVWQIHWGTPSGSEWNSPGAFIANGMDPAAIAAALTAPPRGGGAGGRGQGAPGGAGGPAAPGSAPGAGAPAVGAPAPAPPAAPPAGGPQGGQPGGAGGAARGAGAPGAGGRGGGAGAHTPAYWIKISANADGSFTILNARNTFSKTYPAHVAAASAAPAAGRGR